MADTVSQRFIASLEPHRDRLYGLALAASPARPEMAILGALHGAFAQYEKDSTLDPAGILARNLTPPSANHDLKVDESPMPADIWARLVAAVQMEAARSMQSRVVNPDSVLLSPDPLLAPKKSSGGGNDDVEGFDLQPASRFLLAGVLVVLLAIGLTVYLLTRPGGAHGRPGTLTAPATMPH